MYLNIWCDIFDVKIWNLNTALASPRSPLNFNTAPVGHWRTQLPRERFQTFRLRRRWVWADDARLRGGKPRPPGRREHIPVGGDWTLEECSGWKKPGSNQGRPCVFGGWGEPKT